MVRVGNCKASLVEASELVPLLLSIDENWQHVLHVELCSDGEVMIVDTIMMMMRGKLF